MSRHYLDDPFFRQPRQPRFNQLFSPSGYLESVARQYGGLPDREDPKFKRMQDQMQRRRRDELFAIDALAHENQELNQGIDYFRDTISRYDNFTNSLQSEISKMKVDYDSLKSELDGYKNRDVSSGGDRGVRTDETEGAAAAADPDDDGQGDDGPDIPRAAGESAGGGDAETDGRGRVDAAEDSSEHGGLGGPAD